MRVFIVGAGTSEVPGYRDGSNFIFHHVPTTTITGLEVSVDNDLMYSKVLGTKVVATKGDSLIIQTDDTWPEGAQARLTYEDGMSDWVS